jgi:hypothetical protein
LDSVEIGESISVRYFSIGKAFLLSKQLFIIFKEFVLPWGWQLLLLLSLHDLIDIGKFLGWFYFLLREMGGLLPVVIGTVVISRARIIPMNLRVVFQIVASFSLPLLLLIFVDVGIVLFLENFLCKLVLLLNLIALDAIGGNFVTTAVHLAYSQHV